MKRAKSETRTRLRLCNPLAQTSIRRRRIIRDVTSSVKDTLELIFSGTGLAVSIFAVTLTLWLWWRERYHFRGTQIRLANQDDEQHAASLPFESHPAATRDLFPNY